MSALSDKLQDLRTSETRSKIIDVVIKQTTTFFAHDIVNLLETDGVKVKNAPVQNLLRIMEYRKILIAFDSRNPNRRGRLGKYYEVNKLYQGEVL